MICSKCGREIPDDSKFCPKCGTAMDAIKASNLTINIYETANNPVSISDGSSPADTNNPNPKKKKAGIFVLMLLILAFIACGVYFGLKTPSKQNINEINGSPEFFNVQFGMDPDQIDALVVSKHNTVKGFKSTTDLLEDMDSVVYLEEDANWSLFGIPVKDAGCGFDLFDMSRVFIYFSKEDTTFAKVSGNYKKIYGEPSESGERYMTFSGKYTIIDIFDSDLINDENEIVVRYIPNPNAKYSAFSFDGPEFDPCNFSKESSPLGQPVANYVQGLKEEKDYLIDTFGADGYGHYTKYTLFPNFDYCGSDMGYPAICITSDDSTGLIGTCDYSFLPNPDETYILVDRIYQALSKQYGALSTCDYTSMKRSELGIVKKDYQGWISGIKLNTQGLYSIQWETDDLRITINVTVDPNKDYNECTVAYARMK